MASRRNSYNAALSYWADYTSEVDAFLDHACTEAEQAQFRSQREHDLLER